MGCGKVFQEYVSNLNIGGLSEWNTIIFNYEIKLEMCFIHNMLIAKKKSAHISVSTCK